MSKFDKALEFARLKCANGELIITGELFAPLSEDKRAELRKELVANGFYVFPIGNPEGCQIIRKDSPYLTVTQKDGFTVGTYSKGNKIILLGSKNFDDLVGVM